jgi:hypothetical protein
MRYHFCVRTLFLPRLSQPHDIFREIQEKPAWRPKFEQMEVVRTRLGILSMASQTHTCPLHDFCRTYVSAAII